MITLIAESKTMTACDLTVSPSEYEARCPAGEAEAALIMERIAGMTAPELAAEAKLTPGLAARAIALAYEFPNKSLGEAAVEAFTGVVFKSLDCATLPAEAREHLRSDVRILSSLYGYLRPDDIIKGYRMDFTSPMAPGDMAMAKYWKKDVTIALVCEIKERAGEEVLSLLPADAERAVDRKLVKHFARIWKVDFKELRDGGEYRTPNSTRLKELRGHLLREILLRGLDTPRDLLTLETDRLLPLGTPDYPDRIAFCV